jgi:hypothetical protein
MTGPRHRPPEQRGADGGSNAGSVTLHSSFHTEGRHRVLGTDIGQDGDSTLTDRGSTSGRSQCAREEMLALCPYGALGRDSFVTKQAPP